MNTVSYEQILSLVGLIALWAFWHYLWKPQRTDIFRQRLFALRSDLFDLAANGEVSFDDPAYTQLRLLINGMIRFAHRASLASLVVTVAQSRRAPEDPLIAWRKSAQRLPEDARNRVLAVYDAVTDVFATHLTFGSVLLLGYLSVRVLFAVARAIVFLVIGSRSLKNFTLSHALDRMEREKNQLTKAKVGVIEARVLHEEQRRTDPKRQPAYAH
jgi:hypothetical protein